jgi:hypothetical protein
VHLEYLFLLGAYNGLHKEIQNGVGKEILRIRSVGKDKGKAKAT